MPGLANVRLSLDSRPENVLVVRQALAGVADGVGLNAIESNDLSTAVTEAANNVVLHAYDDSRQGPLEVDVFVRTGSLTVAVRDRGGGIPAEGAHAEDAQSGIGLPVIHALCRRVRIDTPAGGGTEVRMDFAAPQALPTQTRGDGADDANEGEDVDEAEDVDGANEGSSDRASGAVQVRLIPSSTTRTVLPRVLTALAARAHFSTDRIADVQLVADALATNAPHSLSASHLAVDVMTTPRNLTLLLGPLHSGRGESLLTAAADGLAPVIERLTDERHRIVRAGSEQEMLKLSLVERS